MPTAPEAPAAPGSGTYSPPSPTGSVVSSYAELAAEVALSGPRVIVVADGTYTGVSLTTAQGHELWAENFGGATLEFGIGFRGNGPNAGGALHGFVFDVDDIANVDSTALLNEAIVNTWDSLDPYTVGSGLVVEDCTFNGNDVVGAGIQAASPGGLTVRRCTFTNFIDQGIFAYRNGSGENDFDRITIEDVDISNVSRAVPGSGSGATVEAGIYIGQRFDIRRVPIRDCAWAGIVMANEVAEWTLTDYDIDRIGWGYFSGGGVGIYCEQSNNGLIHRGWIGYETKVGINCEWNGTASDPWVDDYTARNYGINITDATILSYKIGIHWDVSVQGCTARDVHIERAWRAGILDNNAFPDADGSYPLPVDELPIYSRNAADLSTCTFLLAEGIPHYLNDHHLGVSAAAPTDWPATPDDYDDTGDVTLSYTAFDRPDPGAGRIPSIAVTPADGSELTRYQPVEVEVTDLDADLFRTVIAYYNTATGEQEIAYQGSHFGPRFMQSSSYAVDGTVTTWTLQRTGGWGTSAEVRVEVADNNRNEATATAVFTRL